MIRKIINYIKEDQFELRIDNQYICIINYTDIHYMEDEKIAVSYLDGTVVIKGNHLVVMKLLENEMLIKGNFQNIEFRRSYE